ncbi:MAG: hypothetical protein QNJ31_00235 [Candidatus Caenarcaniphilales bacterium]|nr:hypothetical protein [Candidatus Caenarcaniphilales bacterium]
MTSSHHFTKSISKKIDKSSSEYKHSDSKDFQRDKFDVLVDLVLRNNNVVREERNTSHKPLDLLILLILNQSTTDLLADRAFADLMRAYKSYEEILKENDLKKLTSSIKICGLAPTKAQYILNTLHYLKENNWLDLELKFIKRMTDQEAIKAITAIKGVGVKSASCLLMFSFQRGTFPIDTHLYRVFKRIGGIFPENTSPEQAHKLIQPRIDGSNSFKVHVSLIEHGRKVCTAPKKPKCGECYIQPICDYYQDNLE